jgi:exopolysaccharide biosynthesis polyprenyl glycosylphosphotransferase
MSVLNDAMFPLQRGLAQTTPQADRALPPIRRDMVFRRSLAVADALAAAGGLAAAGLLVDHGGHPAALATLPLIVLLAKMMGRYDQDELVLRKSTLEEFPALLALAAAFALCWALIAALSGLRLEPGQAGVVVLWASTAAGLAGGRTAARAVARLSAPHERVLIVGTAEERARLARLLGTDPGARLQVVGFLPVKDERRRSDRRAGEGRRPALERRRADRERRQRQESLADLDEIAARLDVDRVVMLATGVDNRLLLDIVNRAATLGVKVSLIPGLLEVVGSAVEFDTVGGVTLLGLRRHGLSRSSQAIKRAMDIAGASLGIALLAPLWLLVAVAIKLDSPGPVFFRQTRVGRGGRVFRIFKFRSMVDGAEAQRAALESRNETAGLFKLRTDPRVTRVGRLLRRASIDELPQLLNVLAGDMSLVGPRPLVLDEDRLVDGHHRTRLKLAPGMTGPWQVLGPHRPPLSEMVKTDYLYAVNWSLWTDVKILLRTFGHVAARRGL